MTEPCAICKRKPTSFESFIKCNGCNSFYCPTCTAIFLGIKKGGDIDTCPSCSPEYENAEEESRLGGR